MAQLNSGVGVGVGKLNHDETSPKSFLGDFRKIWKFGWVGPTQLRGVGWENSTVTKLHEDHVQDILENFENLVEVPQLNWGGGGG